MEKIGLEIGNMDGWNSDGYLINYAWGTAVKIRRAEGVAIAAYGPTRGMRSQPKYRGAGQHKKLPGLFQELTKFIQTIDAEMPIFDPDSNLVSSALILFRNDVSLL